MAVYADSRADAARRAQGRCQLRLPGCLGAGTEFSHTEGRGAFGWTGDDEGLWACHPCGQWVHAHPNEAHDRGLIRLRKRTGN